MLFFVSCGEKIEEKPVPEAVNAFTDDEIKMLFEYQLGQAQKVEGEIFRGYFFQPKETPEQTIPGDPEYALLAGGVICYWDNFKDVGIQSVADIHKYLRTIYTEACAQRMVDRYLSGQTPRYKDYEGKLYGYIGAEGNGNMFYLKLETLTVKKEEKNTVDRKSVV